MKPAFAPTRPVRAPSSQPPLAAGFSHSPGRRFALLGAVAVLLAGAAPWAGAAEKAMRLQPFSVLQLELPAHYVIHAASAPSVRIDAPPEVLDRIVVEQHDDRVRIFAPGSLSVQGEIAIEVNTVGLGELSVEGAGDVQAHGMAGPEFKLKVSGAAKVNLTALDCDKLRVEMSGSSQVEASGRASTERVKLSGAGSYHAADLASDDAEVKAEGAVDVEVMARDKLRVRLSGASNLRYRGDPKLNSGIDGVGTITKM